MEIKEQVLNELAQFCREAKSNTDLGERADTMDKFAENIVKLFAIPVVSDIVHRAELEVLESVSDYIPCEIYSQAVIFSQKKRDNVR